MSVAYKAEHAITLDLRFESELFEVTRNYVNGFRIMISRRILRRNGYKFASEFNHLGEVSPYSLKSHDVWH